MLPPSEEGEAHEEVGGLDEAVVSQMVLVRALREEHLIRVTISSLQIRCSDIMAQRLILSLVIDKTSDIVD